jgi:hypothetical protein
VKKNRASKIVALAGLTWSVVMSIVLVFVPVYSGSSVSRSCQAARSSTATLIQVNGWWVLSLLAIPVLLAAAVALPILRTTGIWGVRRAVVWIGAVILLIFVVLAGFSIGFFYLPAALLLIAAAVLAEINIRKTMGN